MHLLTFEPLTGALTMFAFENICRTRPMRILPHARVILRRHSDVFLDAVVSEVTDPLMDVGNIHFAFIFLVAMAIIWQRVKHRQRV